MLFSLNSIDHGILNRYYARNFCCMRVKCLFILNYYLGLSHHAYKRCIHRH